MSRVSTFAQHTLLQQSIMRTQERIFDRQAQVSSGKEALSFAGISKEAGHLVSIKAATVRSDTFIKQNSQIDSRLQIADGALSNMADLASSLKAKIIQRQNAATGSSSVLDQDASIMLDSLVALLNTQVAGRFLFGGTRTDIPPVPDPVPNPTVFGVPDATYYQGNSLEQTARVSENQEVPVGLAGDRLGFQQLIGAFKAAIQGHVTDDSNMLDDALDLADRAIDEINAYRSEGGFVANAVARATATHQDFQLYAEQVVTEIENVDIPSAVAALSADETALQASFMIVGRLASMSLADYLP